MKFRIPYFRNFTQSLLVLSIFKDILLLNDSLITSVSYFLDSFNRSPNSVLIWVNSSWWPVIISRKSVLSVTEYEDLKINWDPEKSCDGLTQGKKFRYFHSHNINRWSISIKEKRDFPEMSTILDVGYFPTGWCVHGQCTRYNEIHDLQVLWLLEDDIAM